MWCDHGLYSSSETGLSPERGWHPAARTTISHASSLLNTNIFEWAKAGGVCNYVTYGLASTGQEIQNSHFNILPSSGLIFLSLEFIYLL
jgi:hypothetical protein